MAETKFKTYSVADFLGWQRAGTLTLSPSFQRRPVWSAAARSLLIDSIVRGIPVPMVFLRELPADLTKLSSKREVVDGQQRLRTVLSFIESSVIEGFDESRDAFTVRKSHNKSIAGRKFSALEPDYQQAILQYEFSVYIFPATTSDQEILQIFARLNSTGIKLNPQELRNAEFVGEFKTLAYELAAEQLERWRAWHVFSESDIARMQEVELMSEFMQVVMSGIAAKTKSSLDSFYRRYDDEFDDAATVATRCRTTMDVMEEKLGRDLRALPSKQKTLSYAVFCAVYDLLFGLGSPLVDRKPRQVSLQSTRGVSESLQRIAVGKAPEKVLNATARRTTHKMERTTLVNYLRKH